MGEARLTFVIVTPTGDPGLVRIVFDGPDPAGVRRRFARRYIWAPMTEAAAALLLRAVAAYLDGTDLAGRYVLPPDESRPAA